MIPVKTHPGTGTNTRKGRAAGQIARETTEPTPLGPVIKKKKIKAFHSIIPPVNRMQGFRRMFHGLHGILHSGVLYSVPIMCHCVDMLTSTHSKTSRHTHTSYDWDTHAGIHLYEAELSPAESIADGG